MREDCTVRELKKVLSEKIPRYMIPSLYHEVLEIPTLPNGKIDRKRIQLVEKKENNCQTDLNFSEQDILNVIIGILKRPIISLDVLIEECGVSSLEAISLIYELEKRYKVKVVLAQLMKYTFGEIIDMVTHIRNQKKVCGLAEARRILEKQFQKKFCLAENKYKENDYFLYFEGKNEDKEEILKFIDMNFDEDFFPTKVVALEQLGDCIPTEEHVKHKELFERVQKRREQVRTTGSRGKHRPNKRERLIFSGVLICAECGCPYSHIQPHSKRVNGIPKWKCKNYVYQNKVSCGGGFISDRQVEEVCTIAINKLIQNPGLTEKYEMKEQQVSPEYRRITRCIEESEDKDADEMMALLFRQASERYKTLEVRDEDIKAEEMREVLDGRKEIEEFDEELYRKLIKQIVVHKDDSVRVIFPNNNSIKIGYRDL